MTRHHEVDCPRCAGGMSVMDLRRCGPSCRLESPPERTCGFCGGRGVVSEEDADGYDDGFDYEAEREEAAREAAWEAREDARRDWDWEDR